MSDDSHLNKTMEEEIEHALEIGKDEHDPNHPEWNATEAERTRNELLAFRWDVGGWNQGHIAVKQNWLDESGEWDGNGFRVNVMHPNGELEGTNVEGYSEAAATVVEAMESISDEAV